MLLLGLILLAVGAGMLACSLRPWGHTRAVWRGMTGDEAARWDGLTVDRGRLVESRAGAALVLAGIVVLVVGGIA